METERHFTNQQEQEHYEALCQSMYFGLVITERGLKIDGRRDAIAHTTSLLLQQGKMPKFQSGGEVFKAASVDFCTLYRDRIKKFIRKSKTKWWHIKTGHRYSRRNNPDMV